MLIRRFPVPSWIVHVALVLRDTRSVNLRERERCVGGGLALHIVGLVDESWWAHGAGRPETSWNVGHSVVAVESFFNGERLVASADGKCERQM